MKKISKILTLVLALCMVLALAACGSSAAPAATTAPAADGDAAADTGAAAPAIDWPKKNVTIIVGYGAGGDTDLAARVLADALSNKLGANFVVNNLAGGSGVVGRTELLANDGDGYTLMFDQPGSPITQVLMGNTTYELDEAGTPIAVVGVSPCALCVKKDNALGINNMDDLIAYAQANPGKLTYAIPGQFTSAHLAALNAFSALGVEATSVSTDGTATCVTEVLGNHVDAMIVPLSGAQQYIASGDMILVGLSAPSDFEPDAPLLSAYEGVSDYNTWYSIWGGNGMDPTLAQYISEQIGAVLEDEALAKSLADLGIEVQFQDYAATVETANNYRTIIKDALVAGGALSE